MVKMVRDDCIYKLNVRKMFNTSSLNFLKMIDLVRTGY